MTTETPKTTTEPITNRDDVEVGDTVDVSGQSFLPKSNLEVVEVDHDPDHYDHATHFMARIPNRSNARDYWFQITDGGFVKTTNSAGYFRDGVTAKKVVDVTPDDEANFDNDGEPAIDVGDVARGDTVELTYESRRSGNDKTVRGVVTSIRYNYANGDIHQISIDTGEEDDDGEPVGIYKFGVPAHGAPVVSTVGPKGNYTRVGRAVSVDVYHADEDDRDFAVRDDRSDDSHDVFDQFDDADIWADANEADRRLLGDDGRDPVNQGDADTDVGGARYDVGDRVRADEDAEQTDPFDAPRHAGKEGTVKTVGTAANAGHYEVQFETFDGWEDPELLTWVDGDDLSPVDEVRADGGIIVADDDGVILSDEDDGDDGHTVDPDDEGVELLPDGGTLSCEACDRDALSKLPDDDNRGAFRCGSCGAFVDEDGKLPRADDKRCPKCHGPVAYGVLKDARKGLRGYLCVDGCDDRRIVRPEDEAPVATDGGTDELPPEAWVDERFRRDPGPPVDGGDVDRCELCRRYAPHAFDHAPDCPRFEPVEAEPDTTGTPTVRAPNNPRMTRPTADGGEHESLFARDAMRTETVASHANAASAGEVATVWADDGDTVFQGRVDYVSHYDHDERGSTHVVAVDAGGDPVIVVVDREGDPGDGTTPPVTVAAFDHITGTKRDVCRFESGWDE